MEVPAFYDDVPPILVRDALAETLGAAAGGLMDYRYVDAVKLAGHSCPTVAGAWLMTRAALAHLYPGEIPRRGQLRVTRLDTGRSVEVSHHPQAVARPPALARLMQAALAPDADPSERAAFGAAWQDWVRCMLIEHADDPALVTLED